MSNMATLMSDLQTVLKALGLAQAAGLREEFLSRLINDPDYRARFVAAELNDFVALSIPSNERREFPVWRTLRLGTRKTPPDCIQVLEKLGVNISRWAWDTLVCATFMDEPTEVDLVSVRASDLGFTGPARREEIYRRAQDLGLELCPVEIGPLLREQYLDQPHHDWFLIGMEPAVLPGGFMNILRLVHDRDGLWLSADNGRPERVWFPSAVWVFCRSRR